MTRRNYGIMPQRCQDLARSGGFRWVSEMWDFVSGWSVPHLAWDNLKNTVLVGFGGLLNFGRLPVCQDLSKIYRTSVEHPSSINRNSIEHRSKIKRTPIEIDRTSIEHLSNIYRATRNIAAECQQNVRKTFKEVATMI